MLAKLYTTYISFIDTMPVFPKNLEKFAFYRKNIRILLILNNFIYVQFLRKLIAIHNRSAFVHSIQYFSTELSTDIVDKIQGVEVSKRKVIVCQRIIIPNLCTERDIGNSWKDT